MHDLKNIALQIFQETLAAIDIRATLVDKLARAGSCIQVDDRTIDLAAYREIMGIAIGKAAFPMAEGLADLLAPDFQVTGILVAPAAPSTSLPGWETIIAGHPVPTAESFRAGRAILERLSRCDDRTLVFFLLSGGGSALVEQPLDRDISLEDFQQLHRALVTCGAPIEQINAVRKHLSATKGGRLAAAAPHATKITLGVSDVPQGFESALASGPTLPDPTTVQDALRVVNEFSLLPKLPPKIREMFVTQSLPESPKEGDPVFDRAHFLLLLGMRDLFHHGHQADGSHGFLTICDDCTDGWPIDKAADYLLSQLAELQLTNLGKRVAVISDGEVSSPVTGNGLGGRNSAFVLACVEKIAGRHVAVLSAGTDGIDGNSFAAGAVADGKTLLRARDARMDPADFLRRSDSYTFFEQLSDAVITGPTGNNLRDFRILLTH
ncbi:MAG: glycerate kinase type-2 family protein [Candidatus Acidiferrales bacterium]